MAQTYLDAPATEAVPLSRPKFLDRDEALRSAFRGASAPTDPAPVDGQCWLNSTTLELSRYVGGAWTVVHDFPPALTITDLTGRDAAATMPSGGIVNVLGSSAIGDCPAFQVKWDASSSVAADGALVYRPTVGAASTGNGRWIRVNVSPSRTFANSDATPSIANGSFFVTAGTPPTAVTDFDDAFEGQRFSVQRGSADQKITHDPTKIDLGGADLILGANNPRADFVHVGGIHRLISSSASSALTAILREVTASLAAARLGAPNWFNIKDPTYGAIADGADDGSGSDNTTAVQAAIDACSGAGGGVVYAPRGKYAISQVTLPSNVHLIGDGRDQSIFVRKTGTTLTMVLAMGTSGSRLQNIQIRDLTVRGLVAAGASTNGGTAYGVRVAYADGVLIQNVRAHKHNDTGIICQSVSYSEMRRCRADGNWIGGYWSGFWTGSTSYSSQYVVVEDNDFRNNANDGFDFDFDMVDSAIINNRAFDNDADLDGDGGGIVIASDLATYPCRRIQILGNRTNHPISLSGTQGFQVIGNYVRDTKNNTTSGQTQFGHGIEVFSKIGQAPCKNGLVALNHIERTGKYGIAIIQWKAAYGAGTTYAIGNNVTYSGRAYQSLQNSNTGHQPDISGTYWLDIGSATQDNITIGPNYIEDPGGAVANTYDGIYADGYTRNLIIESGGRIVQVTSGQMRYAVNIASGVTGAMLGGYPDAGTTGTVNNASSSFVARYTAVGEKAERTDGDQHVGGTSYLDGQVYVEVDDATNNNVTRRLHLQHTTSGTPANGIGVGFDAIVETTAGNMTAGAIDFVAADVTSGSEDFDISFKVMTAGAAMAEVARMLSTKKFGVGGSPTAVLDVITSSGTADFKLRNGTVTMTQFVDGGAGYMGTVTSHPFLMLAGNSEKARLNTTGDLQMGGTNTVIDVTRLFHRRVYTVSTLPAGAAGVVAFAADLRVFNGAGTQEGAAAGTGGGVEHNGTAWKIPGTNVTAVA